MVTITRKKYLETSTAEWIETGHSKQAFRDYYRQFVTEETVQAVTDTFGLPRLVEAFREDPHLNNLPLRRWDLITLHGDVVRRLREAGDYLTLAGRVCILKEAARVAIEGSGAIQTLRVPSMSTVAAPGSGTPADPLQCSETPQFDTRLQV